MPYVPHDDRDLHKIALLPIPQAVEMLEQIPAVAERHRLADRLARFWRGGVDNLARARAWVARSKLDDQSKQMLSSALMD